MLANHPFHSDHGIILFAHRGGGGEVPENSYRSFEHVRRLGLSYVETDAHATSDGIVILHHDPTLERTTDGKGPVSAHSWQELATLRDQSGGQLVRLEEALERYPSLKFNVDAKSDAVVEPLAALAKKHPERIGLASFSAARLGRLRELAPGVANSLAQREVAQLWLATRLRLPRAQAARMLPRGATAVQIPPRYRGIPILGRPLVALAHDLSLAVHVWGVEDAAAWGRVLDTGADGICTDFPAAARAFLQARGHIS